MTEMEKLLMEASTIARLAAEVGKPKVMEATNSGLTCEGGAIWLTSKMLVKTDIGSVVLTSVATLLREGEETHGVQTHAAKLRALWAAAWLSKDKSSPLT